MSIELLRWNAISLVNVLTHIMFTRSRIMAEPLTQGMVADWDDQLQKWKVVHAQEVELQAAQALAAANVRVADDALDQGVTAFAAALVVKVDNKREHPLYTRYFGALNPSQLKRFVLGRELETVQGWVAGLKASGDAMLVDFGNRFEKLVAAGVAAQQQAIQADAAMSDFRRTGARMAFFDGLNAARKATEGKLATMPHSMPDAHLPADFADGFFLRAPRSANGKPEGVQELDDAITEAQAHVVELQRQRDKAADEEKAAADEKAKELAEEQRKKREAAQKKLTDAQAELAALDAEPPKPK